MVPEPKLTEGERIALIAGAAAIAAALLPKAVEAVMEIVRERRAERRIAADARRGLKIVEKKEEAA